MRTAGAWASVHQIKLVLLLAFVAFCLGIVLFLLSLEVLDMNRSLVEFLWSSVLMWMGGVLWSIAAALLGTAAALGAASFWQGRSDGVR